jgi:pSer/pThr/pTyr-binding forkhead associated (FHA) protein
VPELPPALRLVTPRELARRIETERRGTPFLLYLDGDGRQSIASLPGHDASLSVGRLASSDVALTWDTEVSRLHAVLERVGEEWTVADEGLSRNGSYLNGRRLRGRRRLSDGDAITIGRTLLIFRAGARLDGRTTATTQDGEPPRLSDAQRRVLTALCGLAGGGIRSNREIADELFLGVETVKSHLRAMFELFGLSDLPQNRKRSELARRAVEMGLVREAD